MISWKKDKRDGRFFTAQTSTDGKWHICYGDVIFTNPIGEQRKGIVSMLLHLEENYKGEMLWNIISYQDILSQSEKAAEEWENKNLI